MNNANVIVTSLCDIPLLLGDYISSDWLSVVTLTGLKHLCVKQVLADLSASMTRYYPMCIVSILRMSVVDRIVIIDSVCTQTQNLCTRLIQSLNVSSQMLAEFRCSMIDYLSAKTHGGENNR